MKMTERRRRRRRQGHSTQPAAVASVLGDDDLLVEILLRLDFPTCLVHGAVVCRRWLRLASDPAFLRRFRVLHPPRILGIHVEQGWDPTRFLPLTPDEILPPPPHYNPPLYDSGLILIQHLFLLEDDGDATSCLCLYLAYNGMKFGVNFSLLQSGIWGAEKSAVTELQQGTHETGIQHKLLMGRKLYMVTTAGCILVLDLSTASFFTVELPDGTGHRGRVLLSRDLESGLFLIDVVRFHLRVWHGDGVGQWVLVDTISVREACDHLNVQIWQPDNGGPPVSVLGVGDNAEFAVLKLNASGIVCYMQLSNRVVEKVAEGVPENRGGFDFPITMVWPPIFPVLDKVQNTDP
ncbi:hypothetical protein EJB05_21810, partial [Eragrostis curvula]